MTVRRRFLFALMASLALHLGLLSRPAWLWSWPQTRDWPDPVAGTQLRAEILPPKRQPSPPPAKPKKPPQPRLDAAPVPDVVPPAATVASAEALAPVLVQKPLPEPEAAEATEVPVEEIASEPSSEFPLPRHIRIRYRVTMGDASLLVGQAEHDWRHDGRNYHLRSRTETVGLAALFKKVSVTVVSEGQIVGSHIRPDSFSSEKNGAPGDWARFDWQDSRVSMSGDPAGAQVMLGSQDMLSLFLQLALTNVDGATEFWVATGRKLERYRLVAVNEHEMVRTPYGLEPALHLRTERQGGDQDMTEVWLGLNQARLPIRIRHVDHRGGVFDQVAESIEMDNNDEGLR